MELMGVGILVGIVHGIFFMISQGCIAVFYLFYGQSESIILIFNALNC